MIVHHLLLSGQCGKVIVTLGRRYTNRHRYSGKTVTVRKVPRTKTEAGVERWLLEDVPLHVILASAHALFFFLFIFIWREGKKKLALKVKKSPAVIIFLLALEHLKKKS